MNILLLAPHPFYQHRGTPIAVNLLLKVLSQDGHHITVLTYAEGESVNHPGCRIVRIEPRLPLHNIKPGFSLKKLVCDFFMFFKANGLMRNNRFDLVHAVEESAYIALYLKRKFRIPYVYDMDSSLAQQLVEKVKFLGLLAPLLKGCERYVIRHSIGVLPVCKSLAQQTQRWAPGKPIQLLEDISLRNPNQPSQLPTRCKFSIDGPIVMYIGNLERYQGIDLLIEGFAVARRKVSSGNLVIIGGSDDDIRKYKNQAIALGYGSSIHFLGPRPVSDLFYYLGQASILVSPRTKGVNTPMKIYSYLDSGRALLATRLTTHTQVLDDEIACLVDPNPESMAAGLEKLLSDDSYRTRIAANAKKRALENHTLESFRDNVTRFYHAMSKLTRAEYWDGIGTEKPILDN